jgi:hypothetical protein
MEPDHPSYQQMRLAIESLCISAEAIRARLQAAEQYFSQVRNTALPGSAEWNLYHRIASSLVEGGDNEDGTIEESIAALDETRATDIARDMLHLFELMAEIADDDAPWLWPRHKR